MKQELHIIGFENSAAGTQVFNSINPEKNNTNEFSFVNVTSEEIDRAVRKAADAFSIYRKKSGKEKSAFLHTIAEGLIAAGEELITVCMSETALPAARLEGERMRTVNQLKMFAALLEEGSWVDARIEKAQPSRTPLPKPDLRFMHIPLGPVVVFGASNFPLAFSVAGGDTASALAAGCPVVVKAHPAHPATSAIVGKIIQEAARTTNMPDGVFSLLFDQGIDAGIELVKHPLIKAVAFTGSFKAGKAIFDAAVKRPEPIPVYAEMGSTNPVFVLPHAIRERGEAIAAGYGAAVTMGIGQFCTKPGMMVFENSAGNFKESLKTSFEKTAGGAMLTSSILKAYNNGLQHQGDIQGVEKLATGVQNENSEGTATPLLFMAEAATLQSNPALGEENFGPSSVAIPVRNKEEMMDIARNLSGHLTATVHGTDEDLKEYQELIGILEQKVGRLIINGFPTGVEVCSAMVHGGPYPSTTDSKTTSVGTAAIYRFTRPLSYQNMPDALLPDALKNKNSLGIRRLVDNISTTADIN